MKRNDAINYVIGELSLIKEDIITGKYISPVKFVKLSEVFKFTIEPKDDRFTAVCLDEASKSLDSDKQLEIINDILGDEDDSEGDTEEEVTELLDYDGSIQSSKIPPGTTDNGTMSSKKTTDDVVAATRQSGTWTSAGHYFKRYWGESVEEVTENDMSEILGYEETKDKNAEETIDFFKKEHDMDEIEAIERTEAMGKTEKLDKKGDNYQRLTEKESLHKLSEDKARKMIETLLAQKSTEDDLTSRDTDIMDSKLKRIVRYYKNDKSKEELMDKIKTLWGDE